MIKVNKLVKSFGSNEVLKDITFDVQHGEFLVILGSSGAGKSTLLRCLNGLFLPSSGEIFLNDIEVNKTNKQKIRKNIGFIFQNYNIIENLSVLQNVLIGRLAYKSPFNILFSKKERMLAEEALEIVGLADKMNVRADRLSGGQKQRVGIARVLVQNPKIILADEPVSSLDPVIGREILGLLKKINEQKGTTIICNLHQLSYATEFGQRIIGIRNGTIVYDGQPTDLANKDYSKIYGDKFSKDVTKKQEVLI